MLIVEAAFVIWQTGNDKRQMGKANEPGNKRGDKINQFQM
jgi:hypothetical protein